jgi:hypothetical protein
MRLRLFNPRLTLSPLARTTRGVLVWHSFIKDWYKISDALKIIETPITSTVPYLVVPMSQRTQADAIIRSHVLWAMGGGLIPIPLVDFAAVTAVQLEMLQQLAHLYGVDYSRSNGKAFVSALTGTTLAPSWREFCQSDSWCRDAGWRCIDGTDFWCFDLCGRTSCHQSL